MIVLPILTPFPIDCDFIYDSPRGDVECYDGYKAHERRTAFTFEGRRREVAEVMDRWYEGSPQAGGTALDYFKVRTEEGEVFLLRYNALFDVWAVVLPGREGGGE